ncbi:MAG TPA: NUDIX domain-containing protein [Pirellulaceae bacterium]|nr:NUDIX domain-containing protein [Pirellulaceae bacterium]
MTDPIAWPARGVVAVVPRAGKLLVIERSQFVRAPGMFCFPGGAIEQGESEADAVVRELLEELALPARAVRKLWTSVTPWNVSLCWWLANVQPAAVPQPDPAEVASFQWLTVAEIRGFSNLLASNLEFLAAWERGEFAIDGLGRLS